MSIKTIQILLKKKEAKRVARDKFLFDFLY